MPLHLRYRQGFDDLTQKFFQLYPQVGIAFLEQCFPAVFRKPKIFDCCLGSNPVEVFILQRPVAEQRKLDVLPKPGTGSGPAPVIIYNRFEF